MKHEVIKSLFESEEGWTTQYEIDGIKYGGNTPQLINDSRLLWHIEQAGGLKWKSVLELGPLEGAHTYTMYKAGAKEIIAVEGNINCFRRCLIAEEAMQIHNTHFIHQDFCQYVKNCTRRFDVVSAAGVLYHQLNPAQLIYDIAAITDCVFVWSHVAGSGMPNGGPAYVKANDNYYEGVTNNYGDSRAKIKSYYAGLNENAVWLYPQDMIRCFNDAGFNNIIMGETSPNPNGDCLLFVAKK